MSALVVVAIVMVEVMNQRLSTLARVVKLFILMREGRGCPSALVGQRILLMLVEVF